MSEVGQLMLELIVLFVYFCGNVDQQPLSSHN